jgi:hypothetical protein
MGQRRAASRVAALTLVVGAIWAIAYDSRAPEARDAGTSVPARSMMGKRESRSESVRQTQQRSESESTVDPSAPPSSAHEPPPVDLVPAPPGSSTAAPPDTADWDEVPGVRRVMPADEVGESGTAKVSAVPQYTTGSPPDDADNPGGRAPMLTGPSTAEPPPGQEWPPPGSSP